MDDDDDEIEVSNFDKKSAEDFYMGLYYIKIILKH